VHNRINILSSHATENIESNTAHVETKKDHESCRNNFQEHRFYNKFTLRKQYREDKSSLNKKTSEEEVHSKILNVENNETVAITELYSRDLRLKQKHRYFV